MKTILCFTLLVFFFTISSNGQVYYTYDNNGNRTASYIVHEGDIKPQKKDTAKKDSVPCSINLYPNPTTNEVNVSIPCIQNCQDAMIYISDASGNLISTIKATSSTIQQINLTSFTQGTYYFKIVMCGDQYSYKVVKLTPPSGTPNPVKRTLGSGGK
jgi:hypothetical protein